MSEKQIDLDAMRKLANETRARADAAHKGPWHIHEGDLVDANHKDVFDDWEEAYGPNEDEVGPDTAFICAAQQDVVHLTDAVGIATAEIEQLRKERDALRASLYCPRCRARPHIPDVLKANFSFQQWLAQHPCGYQGPDHD